MSKNLKEMTKKKMLEIIEDLGWAVYESEQDGQTYYELEKYSDAGEDFICTLCGNTPKEVAKDAVDYYQDFDVDEHVKMVMNMNGAPSLSVLVRDAEYIEKMLEQLAMSLAQGKAISMD